LPSTEPPVGEGDCRAYALGVRHRADNGRRVANEQLEHCGTPPRRPRARLAVRVRPSRKPKPISSSWQTSRKPCPTGAAQRIATVDWPWPPVCGWKPFAPAEAGRTPVLG
jgi:hypothetical protein